MVFPSDSRTHGWGGILYHCFCFLTISFRWLSNFPTLVTRVVILWFLASIVGVDWGLHLAIKNHATRTCVRPSSILGSTSYLTFPIFAYTPGPQWCCLNSFDEWIENIGWHFDSIHLTPRKLTCPVKIDGPTIMKNALPNMSPQNESVVFKPSFLRSNRQAVSFPGNIDLPSKVHEGSTTRTAGNIKLVNYEAHTADLLMMCWLYSVYVQSAISDHGLWIDICLSVQVFYFCTINRWITYEHVFFNMALCLVPKNFTVSHHSTNGPHFLRPGMRSLRTGLGWWCPVRSWRVNS